MWLFLNINRDLEELHQPPAPFERQLSEPQNEENIQDLMKWRPRLHYLIRTSRLSMGKRHRESSCTVFAAHEKEADLQSLVNTLKHKVLQVAEHVKVSSMIDRKFETINAKGIISDENSLHLFKKFQQVICETPYEEIPIAWVFLCSLFYFGLDQIVSKKRLLDMAEKCGISNESLKDFSMFYMSFGSIFDLSIVDPDYEYVVVKPIGFLRALDAVLNPDLKSSFDKYPTLQYGIVSEEFCKEFGNEHLRKYWKAYMDALTVVHLAVQVRADSIDLSNLDHAKVYYFVPLTRTGEKIVEVDAEALHVITSIDKSHIFKQAFFVKNIFKFFTDAILVPCTEANQTKIRVKASNLSDVIITLIHHSPTTKIHVSNPDEKVCTGIIKVCYQMAKDSKIDGGATSFDFIVLCSRSELHDAHDIATGYHHILPVDTLQCSACQKKFSGTQLKVWNDVLQKVSSVICVKIKTNYTFFVVSNSFSLQTQ